MATDILELVEHLKREAEKNPKLTRLRRENYRLTIRNMFMEALLLNCGLTQAQAADLLEEKEHRWRVHRAIKCGKLRTNGLTGRDCRIDPVSLLDYYTGRERSRRNKLVR